MKSQDLLKKKKKIQMLFAVVVIGKLRIKHIFSTNEIATIFQSIQGQLISSLIKYEI